MTDFPESHRDLLDAQVASLATVGRNGFPQVTEIWFLHDDGELKLSLNTARLKTRNLQRDPKCSLLLLDLENPYRYLEVRGHARVEADDDYGFAQQAGREVQGGPEGARSARREPRRRDDRAGQRLPGGHERRLIRAARCGHSSGHAIRPSVGSRLPRHDRRTVHGARRRPRDHAEQARGGHRQWRCGRLRHASGHAGRPHDPGRGRHRSRRGGRGGLDARGHRPVRGRDRRRRLLRVLRRSHAPRVHDRRTRDGAGRRQRQPVHRPGDREAAPVPDRGDQRAVGGHPRHAPDLAAGGESVGQVPPGRRPGARRTRRDSRLPGHRHAARAGARERLPLRPVQLDQRAVPPPRATPGGRLDHEEPGARPHLRADRPQGSRSLLRRRDRARRRAHRARPARWSPARPSFRAPAR